MNVGRAALVMTCLVVAGLGVWFAVAQWEQASRMATVASALGAVAAVGVAVWAALRGPVGGRWGSVRVSDTGKATAGRGGQANTGVRGKVAGTRVRVKRTGDADASGGGDANTGFRPD
ncbi:MAG: hypothetical protein M3308_03155 [Actinomycetota bacterium]|nr:hypothetical protein [Actinomycetota bacterium]